MHGYLIAHHIASEAGKYGKIKSLTVEVGDLAELPPKDLKKALEEHLECEIIIKQKKAVIECECGHNGAPKIIGRMHDAVLFECPECGKIPRVLDGAEIILKEVRSE